MPQQLLSVSTSASASASLSASASTSAAVSVDESHLDRDRKIPSEDNFGLNATELKFFSLDFCSQSDSFRTSASEMEFLSSVESSDIGINFALGQCCT